MKKIIILFGLLLVSTISFAETHISPGEVSGIWTFPNSPYIIDGEINIPVDSTLIIEPGVQVLFSGHYKFYIYGRLLAEGTANDTILFTAQDTTIGWWGLRFYHTNTNEQDSSKIVYCKLEYGKAIGGTSWMNRYGGAIFCHQSSKILIKNCLIAKSIAADCGGGIGCSHSSPSFINVTISGNTVLYGNYGRGGGMSFGCSNSSLTNVTISGNTSYRRGGGIYCHDSDISLTDVTICGNTAHQWGSGIYCHSSNPSLFNVTIRENTGSHWGGGIYCSLCCNPSLINVTIIQNSAEEGGGIYCHSTSNPILENVIISENQANLGAGIYCEENSYPSLYNLTISGNNAGSGGGIYCEENSSPILADVTISGNIADYGGGFYCSNASPSFDSVNRCNIFLNFAARGNDLYASGSTIVNIIVDTFTVLQPDDHFAYPFSNFIFDISNGKVEQVNQDLYVSPTGSNTNSGITSDEPLLTISYALVKIIADSISPHTIHLANGTYSSSQTGEIFPLNCRSYVSLQGEDKISTILDGEELSGILRCHNDNYLSIENMRICNGSANKGGGIYCNNSSPNISNVNICGNTASWYGGGISLEDKSDAIITNVTMSINTVTSYEGSGGGINCYDSSPSLTNVIINENTANCWGGGIVCDHSNPSLVNVTITGNSASSNGGGICCWDDSSPSLVNCILWNDSPNEISGSVTATYSDIQDGWPGEGNIDADPLFADPENGDFHLTWANFPIQDSTMSPCIDAGNPDTTGLNLSPRDLDGNPRIVNEIIDMGAYEWQKQVGVDEFDESLMAIGLLQNYPNPFSSSTTISFNLATKLHEFTPLDSKHLTGQARIKIYNVKGQLIKQLSILNSKSSIEWDGRDENGNPLSSGIYFYKLELEDKIIDIKKCLLLK